jgi:H+-translocating NAD(P) transhydrogenase subunit beta
VSDLLYLVAAVLFIVGLKRLSGPRTARSGNAVASLGMLIAVVVTLARAEIVSWATVVAGLLVGAAIGALVALRVAMTAMPQMVAALNGSGGLASALVAGAELLRLDGGIPAEIVVPIVVSVFVGSLTFSGSFIAFGKLQGVVTGRPVVYPGRTVVGALLLAASAGLGVGAGVTQEPFLLAGLAAAALVLGVLTVLAIGGADMPVVISFLNSLSGVAASGAGFVIQNTGLIVGGALVGAAGFILTVQMCVAMNRPLSNVLFGAFGGEGEPAPGAQTDRPVRSAGPEDVAMALSYADSVLFVPGYGLAVAQAQHAARSLADALEERGVRVGYAIHPVAGRMPGHMNVLLAEADVPYEQLLELDQANARAPQTDVMVILGANDVVNPSARDDPGSPIYGMPIIEADRAGTVVVVKRSLSPGFAGVDNPLFYQENTLMFFADAKEALEKVTGALEYV